MSNKARRGNPQANRFVKLPTAGLSIELERRKKLVLRGSWLICREVNRLIQLLKADGEEE